MRWDLVFLPESLALYAEGIVGTLYLLLSSVSAGLVLALLCALALTGRNRPIRLFAQAYTYVIRGTPLLIQVYLIYYGLAQLSWIQARWDSGWPWVYFKDAFFCAWLAFTLNTAAYTAEMLAGAIRETSPGEIEAAQALGLSRWQVLLRIVLPSACRRSLPAYGNEVIMMLHSTSLASAVPALMDVTAAASQIYSTYYVPFETYIAAAAIYLVMTFSLTTLLKRAERLYLAHLSPRTQS